MKHTGKLYRHTVAVILIYNFSGRSIECEALKGKQALEDAPRPNIKTCPGIQTTDELPKCMIMWWIIGCRLYLVRAMPIGGALSVI
jgi:hypothetical protein